ncbi:MAG: hypothetical protein Q9199_007479, partial [Rusavskia elegans]
VFVVLAIYRGRNNPLMQHVHREYAVSTNSDDDAENHGDGRAGGVQGRIEAPYRDEVTSDADGNETATEETHGRDRSGAGQRGGGMVVQPSSIQGGGNEWRS